MAALLIIILVILAFIIGYVMYMSRRYGELQKLGFVGPKPKLIFGTMSLTESAVDQQVKIYKNYKDNKVIAGYLFHSPFLMVTDLDLIKDILVKHFNCFVNRRPKLDVGGVMDEMMISLRDDHWKYVRSMVSPTFSTSKLKLMSKHIENTSKALLENLKEKQERNEYVELKEVLSCFTMDVIARAGFGIEVNSIKDPQNVFVVTAKMLLKQYAKIGLMIFILPFLPLLVKWFGISLIDSKVTSVLTSFVEKAMESRREESVPRKMNDFLQLLVNLEDEDTTEHDGSSKEEQEALITNKYKRGLTKSEIQAVAMLFILAGYDTVSTALSFTLFLLAMHPDALKRAQDEIDEKLGGASPKYDNVQALKFLEMCINEGLRLFPPGFTFERQCSQEVELHGIKFPKDCIINFPVFAIHHDPENWPDPEKYDPDRFAPENQASRNPYAFLPFGSGPRGCIGIRLAILEMKIVLAAILQAMTPLPCEKSVYPIKLDKMQMNAADGLWVKFERRK